MAMLKLCSCGKPIDISLSKCDVCKPKQKERHKLYDRYRRDKEAAAFYNTKAWRLRRDEALLRDFGLCQHCFKEKKITLATEVDHIIPIRVEWDFRLALDNLQSLCHRCHTIKTLEDKKKYYS